MQTLWSRTLRATKCTCRCQQCLSFSTAVARRTTTAARKRLTSLPSSTILYSAIFACAAVADGRSKQQRREKWNHAIEEVKGELVPGEADADTRTLEGREAEGASEKARRKMRDGESGLEFDAEISDLEGMDPHDLAEMLEKAAAGAESPAAAEKLMRKVIKRARSKGADKANYEATEEELSEWESSQRYTMLQADRPDWPENTGPPVDPESFPPQSIYASDSRKKEGLKSRWTRRKLQTMNLSMAKLVLRMCDEADLSMYPLLRKWDPKMEECWIPDNVFWIAMKEKETKKRFLHRIENFLDFTKAPARDERVPEYMPIFGQYPFYEQDAEGDFHHKCHKMNKRIFATFDRCFKGEINFPTLVGHVCEELLVASAPPNITTYNALLLGFTRLKQDAYAGMVLDSLHEVHMRPDEITCAAALTHYIKTDDARNFTRFVQLLTGISTTNYALMLARPTLSLYHNSTLQKLQNRVLRHPRRPDRLVQKARPTPHVMNTVVAGLLKFHGLERTIDICAGLAADGWGLDADGLTRFLHACAERADWEAGLAVWRQLQLLRAHRPAGRPLARDTYLHMLGLCHRCGRPDAFDDVLREADEQAGYHSKPLKRDFAKMRRWGVDVVDGEAEWRRARTLRRELAAKFAAEGRLLGYEVEGVDEDGKGDDGGGGGAAADAPPLPQKSVEELMAEAEARVREALERERRAAAPLEDGEDEVGAPSSSSSSSPPPPFSSPPSSPPPPGKWRRHGFDDGFGDGGDEITWRLQQAQQTGDGSPLPPKETTTEDENADPRRKRTESSKRGKKGSRKGDDDDWALD